MKNKKMKFVLGMSAACLLSSVALAKDITRVTYDASKTQTNHSIPTYCDSTISISDCNTKNNDLKALDQNISDIMKKYNVSNSQALDITLNTQSNIQNNIIPSLNSSGSCTAVSSQSQFGTVDMICSFPEIANASNYPTNADYYHLSSAPTIVTSQNSIDTVQCTNAGKVVYSNFGQLSCGTQAEADAAAANQTHFKKWIDVVNGNNQYNGWHAYNGSHTSSGCDWTTFDYTGDYGQANCRRINGTHRVRSRIYNVSKCLPGSLSNINGWIECTCVNNDGTITHSHYDNTTGENSC